MNLTTDLITVLPELIMAIGGMAALLVGAIRGDKSAGLVTTLVAVLMLVAGWFVICPAAGSAATAFGGSVRIDGFGQYAKILILFGSVLSLVLARDFFKREQLDRFELPILILFATLGMMLMVSSGSFIALYMGLELQSLSLYVLAAFHRDSLRSTEAGLKYFVLGALSSGMLLYGISLIYGFTGTVSFVGVAAAVKLTGVGIGLIFGLVFLMAGLAFKISAVPFHMWTPDVYEGAPTPITAFFATAAKVAALGLFLRAILEPFPDALHQWRQIVVFIAILSMVLGSVAAIGQTNIKRLMAYSSIGHMGFALLGLAAGTNAGVTGVLIYLTIYVATNVGVFVAILAMRRGGKNVETISDLAGLSRTNPGLAFAFAAFMFSLAGIPPLAGFFAKFYVFLAAIQAGLIIPAVIGVLASVVGAYYYLRIVKIIYFDDPAPAFDRDLGIGMNAILAGSTIFTIVFMVGAAPIVNMAQVAAQALVK